ncbi:MAG: hypothetical protein EX263_01035 [Flavobacteriaceae bacterium]|nr:MAG: hypothetical protein EX263_01035 [Flavobacteriaceae bacterium]
MITYLGLCQDAIKTSGLFYKISLGTTFTLNENYMLFDEYDDTFIQPSAFLINNTLGYQFDERSALGVNLEYDWHSQQGFQFLPVHLSFKYNIIAKDDNLFVRGSYGRLIGINQNFRKGTLYKAGLGYQMFDANIKNSWLIGIDFSRKRFGIQQTEKLSSLSLFLEFMVF